MPSATRRLEASDALRAVPLIPRNLALALLHGYRATISHTYGDVCKYYPVVLGVCRRRGAAARRRQGRRLSPQPASPAVIPGPQGGVDDVPPHRRFRHDLTPHGFVVPLRKD